MQAALLFCERTGSWCIALRRLLGGCLPEIVETRSLSECRDVLSERKSGLLVIEASFENLPNLLSWLLRLDREFPDVAVVVVADRSLADYQWVVREAGAMAFVTSPRALGPVATAVRQYFSSRPAADTTAAERIWSRLPWQAAARRGDRQSCRFEKRIPSLRSE